MSLLLLLLLLSSVLLTLPLCLRVREPRGCPLFMRHVVTHVPGASRTSVAQPRCAGTTEGGTTKRWSGQW